MHWLTEVSYIKGHTLRIQFNNGEKKIVDLGPHLSGKVFAPLKDVAFFRKARLNKDIDTVVWPNDADFSPDFLYKIGAPVVQNKRPRIKK
jgi:hypothetical protein